ncbi:MAG: hypothetical protein M3003_04090 [Candidatus Dormibacteraeota bacterium]|nr:hypothetical protein [Candidatus Dormibacteraeota bacterium]
MCLTCGCHLPHENHGKTDYLVIEDLEKSAAIDGYSLDKAVRFLVETVEVAKKEAGRKQPGRRP